MNGTSFLSFNSHIPRIYITSEDDEFDPETIKHWKEEGFDVSYHSMGEGGKAYRDTIKSWSANLKLGQSFAIIAYGEAATVCLDIAAKPIPHCCALVCYYPDRIPRPNQSYPSQLNVVVHLAKCQGLTAKFPMFVYSDVEEGFAEHDLDLFNANAASVAWTRSLKALRQGFKKDVDLETMKDAMSLLAIDKKDVKALTNTMHSDAHVNFVPTGTGGIGTRALFHFYKDFFIPGRPPSLKTALISRTSGVDRVVDELVVSFKHTQVVPWILPGVPPTNKFVEIGIVSIVAIRGTKLMHEHVYWDQASVLAQIGALDPNHIPKALASKGCKRLPIMGAAAAKKLLDARSVPSNDLIPNW